ncbi:hypothetical protein OG754_39260 [Streptomyces decoyicus]|uniref:hypothetical protein n=1 Tax=Streptomyces decoyicus TaxID=249567 RepID=UPI002E2FDCC1|nr:hypothetical protein [Streptomyces decoyicus]
MRERPGPVGEHREDLGAGELHRLVLDAGDNAQPAHMGVVAFVLPLPTGQVRVDDEVDGQVPKVSNPFPVRLVGCTKLTYQFLSPAAV